MIIKVFIFSKRMFAEMHPAVSQKVIVGAHFHPFQQVGDFQRNRLWNLQNLPLAILNSGGRGGVWGIRAL
ncbi:hypothetical protein D3C71_967670 [compost metagenome]